MAIFASTIIVQELLEACNPARSGHTEPMQTQLYVLDDIGCADLIAFDSINKLLDLFYFHRASYIDDIHERMDATLV